MQAAATRPTRVLIETRQIVEGKHYDFKRLVDLSKGEDGRAKKERFINDVVAFLNSGRGHLIIGVDDKKTGEWQEYHPLRGNRDEIARQLIQTIHDNIEPVPNKVEIGFIDIDDGFLVDIYIPAHTMQPFMNRMTGGFYERTGPKNRPMSREEVMTRFLPLKELKEEGDKRFLEEGNDLSFSGMASFDVLRGVATGPEGSVYRFGVLPRQYASGLTPYYVARRSKAAVYGFDGQHFVHGLRGDDGGFVATRNLSGVEDERLFVGTDWYVSGFSRNPLWLEPNGKLNLDAFGRMVRDHLAFLDEFYAQEGIGGPLRGFAGRRRPG